MHSDTSARSTSAGWLAPRDDWLRSILGRPELSLVAESCAAEVALHSALVAAPQRAVSAAELAAVQDADARSNHATFLAFRDALVAAGTLENWYLGQMRGGAISVPPAFIDGVVQAIVQHVLGDGADAFEARAAELLFRPQRVSLTDGRMLAADRNTMDLLHATAGLGDIGRLLLQANAPMPATTMAVLSPDNAADYRAEIGRHRFLLDLTHEITSDIGHGLSFTMTRAHSGLKALARVLERWLQHLLGVAVTITPLQKIDDAAWRWHVGLDVESMALLNDLYEERPVDDARLQRLVSLFRLDFANPAEMRADVAGKPVYLGLAMTAEGTLRLKPQNLLLNLPLARPM
ncbi:MAG: DUF6352 family protein [Burkholderiales bacterium]